MSDKTIHEIFMEKQHPRWDDIDNKIKQIFSVKDFGAKGDGVTDDTEAIKKALETNKTAYFPKGYYIISETLEMKSGYKIIGQSQNLSVIIQITNNIPVINVTGAHYQIDNIYLTHSIQQLANHSGGLGIELGNASIPNAGAHEGKISNVIIEKSFRGIAIPTWGGTPFAFMNTFENIRVLGSTDWSFHLEGAGNIGLTTNTFNNCYALHYGDGRHPDGGGFYIGLHDDFTMKNCAVDHARDRALMVVNSKGTINDFHMEACKITKDYRQLVQFENSKIWIGNLQVCYCDSLVSKEAYIIQVMKNSVITINNYTERDNDKTGSGVLLSIINDDNSRVTLNSAEQQYPNADSHGLMINKSISQHYSKPSTGKWNRGDIVYNSYPNENSPLGWLCTESGTFGTNKQPLFKAFGMLSSDPDALDINLRNLNVESIQSTKGFTKLTRYDANANSGFQFGSSNDDSVNIDKYYKYEWTTQGNSLNGQNAIFRGYKRDSSTPDDILTIKDGTVASKVITVTTNTTLNSKHEYVFVNATSSAKTITLPTANDSNKGRVYVIKKIDSSNNIVTVFGSINNGSNVTLSTKDSICKVISDGTTWQTIN